MSRRDRSQPSFVPMEGRSLMCQCCFEHFDFHSDLGMCPPHPLKPKLTIIKQAIRRRRDAKRMTDEGLEAARRKPAGIVDGNTRLAAIRDLMSKSKKGE